MADFSPKVLNLTTDAQGKWGKDVPDTFMSGVHSIIVADDKGGENVSFFTLETKPTNIVERVTNIIPAAYLWYFLILGAVITALIVNNFRIAYQADKYESDKKAVPVTDKKMGWRYKVFFHYRRQVLWSVVLMAVLSTGIVAYQLIKNPLSESPLRPIINAPEETPVQVSGTVVDPITKKPVTGVELTVDNTTIRTGSGGSFMFSNVYPSKGIKINHPKLLVTIIKLPEDDTAVQTMDFYFDPAMYKKLVQYIDLESRGRYGEIYNLLPDELKLNIEPDDFVKNYHCIYGQKDIAQQNIVIRHVKTLEKWGKKDYNAYWKDVLSFEIFNEDQSSVYYLIKSGEEWVVLK